MNAGNAKTGKFAPVCGEPEEIAKSKLGGNRAVRFRCGNKRRGCCRTPACFTAGCNAARVRTFRLVEAIPKEAVDLLIEEHAKHPDNPYMFPSPVTGGMWYPDAVNRLNTKMLQDLGMEHMRFHDLRHTFATVALQSGVDIRTVSGMLGHTDPGFTLRTYTHATNPMQVHAAETIGKVMSGRR